MWYTNEDTVKTIATKARRNFDYDESDDGRRLKRETRGKRILSQYK